MSDINNMPADWAGSDQLDGLDVIDKQELIEVPFRIIGAYFSTNARNVRTAFIDGERMDGSVFTFADSSTGVKQQLITYLNKLGKDAVVESETQEYVDLSLVVPRGLRPSTYEVPEVHPVTKRETGKMRTARTFYLTGNNERRRGSEAAKPAAKPAANKR